MLKFCTNINLLFSEVDFTDRFAAAANVGFQAVEFHHPEGCDPATVIEKANQAGVQIALFNAFPGDFLQGGPGFIAVPGREEPFRMAIEQAAAFGTAIGGGAGVQVGPALIADGVDRLQSLEVYKTNVQYAVSKLDPVGCRVMIEPMNTLDYPNSLIPNVDVALKIMEDIGDERVALQFDCYHEAMIGGDVEATIRRVHPHVGHLQFADAPGRNEPGTGQLNYSQIFKTLDTLGYDGWVAAEYQPTGSSSASLAWLRTYQEIAG